MIVPLRSSKCIYVTPHSITLFFYNSWPRYVVTKLSSQEFYFIYSKEFALFYLSLYWIIFSPKKGSLFDQIGRNPLNRLRIHLHRGHNVEASLMVDLPSHHVPGGNMMIVLVLPVQIFLVNTNKSLDNSKNTTKPQHLLTS